jgi:hypothetical protein
MMRVGQVGGDEVECDNLDAVGMMPRQKIKGFLV